MLSQYYAFSPGEILNYFDKLNRPWLFRNKVAHWDDKAISQFVDKIDWKLFSCYSGAFSKHILIDHFQDFIIWEDDQPGLEGISIASNRQIGWTAELVAKFIDRLDFKTLSWNTNVEWSEKLIDQYYDRWDWHGLSANCNLPWSEPFLEKYADKWDWDDIVFFNDNFPWSLTIARKFKHQILKLDHDFLFDNGSFMIQPDIVDEFPEIVDWELLANNKWLPWKEKKLLEHWSEQLAPFSIKYNETFFSDPDYFEANLLEYMQDLPDSFFIFSSSWQIAWTTEFIRRFESLWDFSSFSINSHLPWSEEFIDRYIDRWEWGSRIYTIENQILGNLGLIHNTGVPWTINLILKYEKYIDFYSLAGNEDIWGKAFLEYFNPGTVDEFFTFNEELSH